MFLSKTYEAFVSSIQQPKRARRFYWAIPRYAKPPESHFLAEPPTVVLALLDGG
jgi:hypothetical protein